jgi:hypothetical protein
MEAAEAKEVERSEMLEHKPYLNDADQEPGRKPEEKGAEQDEEDEDEGEGALSLLRLEEGLEEGDTGLEFALDGETGRFLVVGTPAAQAAAACVRAGDELCGINGVAIDGGGFDAALARKLLDTASRPFTVALRKRQQQVCAGGGTEKKTGADGGQQDVEDEKTQQQSDSEEAGEKEEGEEEEEEEEAKEREVAATELPEPAPPSHYELAMRAARCEAARLLAGTAHSSRAAHAVSRLVPLRPRGGAAGSDGGGKGERDGGDDGGGAAPPSSSPPPPPAPSVLDTQQQLEYGGQKWVAKVVDAAAHGFAFGVQAQRRRPVRLEAVCVACGAGGCRGAPLSLFVCEGEGWRAGEGDGGNTTTMPRVWRRAGTGRLGAKGELTRVQLRPPLLLLAGRQVGICVHTPRHPRAVGFALQPDPSEGGRAVTGADACVTLLSGGALHTAAAGVDGLHGAAIGADGLAFSGRVEYTALALERPGGCGGAGGDGDGAGGEQGGEDDAAAPHASFAQLDADAQEIERRLLAPLTVDPPVEYPRRAQTRNPRGSPCYTGWS